MSHELCPACHGTGKCPSCGGTGFIALPANVKHPGPSGTNLCASCFGTGTCRQCGAAKDEKLPQKTG